MMEPERCAPLTIAASASAVAPELQEWLRIQGSPCPLMSFSTAGLSNDSQASDQPDVAGRDAIRF